MSSYPGKGVLTRLLFNVVGKVEVRGCAQILDSLV